MSYSKSTLLTNVFNEEYLLPFWLHHHKDMFDEIIVIDYNSTDKSMEICKKICPECKIIKTRNEYFDAQEIDKEFMDIENTIEGIKIVLNTTEFLFCEKSIKDLFISHTEPISYLITAVSPYSRNSYDINNLMMTLFIIKTDSEQDKFTIFLTADIILDDISQVIFLFQQIKHILFGWVIIQ